MIIVFLLKTNQTSKRYFFLMAIPYELYTVIMMIYFNVGMELRFSEYASGVVGKNAIKMNFMEFERYIYVHL